MYRVINDLPTPILRIVQDHPTVKYLVDDWLSAYTSIDANGHIDISPVDLITMRMLGTTIDITKFTKRNEDRDRKNLLTMIDGIINDLHHNNPQLKPLMLKHKLGVSQ